jgi:hypothetical protein
MNRKDIPNRITGQFLASHPDCIFVFGDNLKRRGYGGGATLRDYKNTYGFITKKYPTNEPKSFYTPEEYTEVFLQEIKKFLKFAKENMDKTFLVSKLGAGLANRHQIFEKIIHPYFKRLEFTKQFLNIILLDWD